MANIFHQYIANEKAIMNSAISKDFNKVKILRQKQAQLKPLADMFQQYQKVIAEMEDLEKLRITEPELSELASDELTRLSKRKHKLSDDMKFALLETHEEESKRLIMELSGAAGGDEANIFAGDLFNMYSR